MNNLYEFGLAVLMIVGGLIPVHLYQKGRLKKIKAIKNLVVGICFIIAGLFYLFLLVLSLF